MGMMRISVRLRFECFVTWVLSRSVYVRACVRNVCTCQIIIGIKLWFR